MMSGGTISAQGAVKMYLYAKLAFLVIYRRRARNTVVPTISQAPEPILGYPPEDGFVPVSVFHDLADGRGGGATP